MKKWVILLTVCLSSSMLFAQTAFSPEQHKTVCSERSDGRYLSTYGVVHAMLKDTKPLYAFRHDFTRQEFAEWQKEVRTAMIEIMHHPHITGQPIPVCIEKLRKECILLEMSVC